jgi:hypothetical protein
VGQLRFFISLVSLLIVALPAHAIGIYTPYLETGFGYSLIKGGQSFFSPASSSAGGSGFGMNAMLGFPLLHQSVSLQPQIGFKAKLSSASASDGSLGILTATPMLRLETPRFYVGLGLSPLVWKRVQPAFGFDGLEKVPNALGYMSELGLLWRVAPFFHVALEGGAYMVSGASGLSPRPAFDASFQMRFFFWEEPSSTAGAKGRRRYDGWRYPFGLEL